MRVVLGFWCIKIAICRRWSKPQSLGGLHFSLEIAGVKFRNFFKATIYF